MRGRVRIALARCHWNNLCQQFLMLLVVCFITAMPDPDPSADDPHREARAASAIPKQDLRRKVKSCDVSILPTKRIVCYLRANDRHFEPRHLDPCLCTHVVYASLPVTNNMTIMMEESNIDELQSLVATKSIHPNLKILVAVSGLDLFALQQSEYLDPKLLAERLVEFLHRHRLDGIDLNWEYKGGHTEGGGNLTSAANNLAEVVQVVATAMQHPSSSASESLTLTISRDVHLLLHGYKFDNIVSSVGHFTLPPFRISKKSRHVTEHPGRLQGAGDMDNVDSLVDLLITLGIPKEKIIIGVPTSGVAYILADRDHRRLGSPTQTPSHGDEQKTSAPWILSHPQICSMTSSGNWTLEREEEASAPYAYRDVHWIAFDDEISFKMKTKYVLLRSLGGVSVWTVNDDDHKGVCNRGPFPLLRSVHDLLVSAQHPINSFTDADVVMETGESRVLHVVDKEGHIRRLDSGNADPELIEGLQCTRAGYFRVPRDCTRFYRCARYGVTTSSNFVVFLYDCPEGLVFDEKDELCNWPSWSPPCEGSGEILPVPKRNFECPSPGYHRDPEHCKWFFYCSNFGNGNMKAFEFRCPSLLLGFDEEQMLCNWKWLVPGCGSLSGDSRRIPDIRAESAPGASRPLSSSRNEKLVNDGTRPTNRNRDRPFTTVQGHGDPRDDAARLGGREMKIPESDLAGRGRAETLLLRGHPGHESLKQKMTLTEKYDSERSRAAFTPALEINRGEEIRKFGGKVQPDLGHSIEDGDYAEERDLPSGYIDVTDSKSRWQDERSKPNTRDDQQRDAFQRHTRRRMQHSGDEDDSVRPQDTGIDRGHLRDVEIPSSREPRKPVRDHLRDSDAALSPTALGISKDYHQRITEGGTISSTTEDRLWGTEVRESPPKGRIEGYENRDTGFRYSSRIPFGRTTIVTGGVSDVNVDSIQPKKIELSRGEVRDWREDFVSPTVRSRVEYVFTDSEPRGTQQARPERTEVSRGSEVDEASHKRTLIPRDDLPDATPDEERGRPRATVSNRRIPSERIRINEHNVRPTEMDRIVPGIRTEEELRTLGLDETSEKKRKMKDYDLRDSGVHGAPIESLRVADEFRDANRGRTFGSKDSRPTDGDTDVAVDEVLYDGVSTTGGSRGATRSVGDQSKPDIHQPRSLEGERFRNLGMSVIIPGEFRIPVDEMKERRIVGAEPGRRILPGDRIRFTGRDTSLPETIPGRLGSRGIGVPPQEQYGLRDRGTDSSEFGAAKDDEKVKGSLPPGRLSAEDRYRTAEGQNIRLSDATTEKKLGAMRAEIVTPRRTITGRVSDEISRLVAPSGIRSTEADRVTHTTGKASIADELREGKVHTLAQADVSDAGDVLRVLPERVWTSADHKTVHETGKIPPVGSRSGVSSKPIWNLRRSEIGNEPGKSHGDVTSTEGHRFAEVDSRDRKVGSAAEEREKYSEGTTRFTSGIRKPSIGGLRDTRDKSLFNAQGRTWEQARDDISAEFPERSKLDDDDDGRYQISLSRPTPVSDSSRIPFGRTTIVTGGVSDVNIESIQPKKIELSRGEVRDWREDFVSPTVRSRVEYVFTDSEPRVTQQARPERTDVSRGSEVDEASHKRTLIPRARDDLKHTEFQTDGKIKNREESVVPLWRSTVGIDRRIDITDGSISQGRTHTGTAGWATIGKPQGPLKIKCLQQNSETDPYSDDAAATGEISDCISEIVVAISNADDKLGDFSKSVLVEDLERKPKKGIADDGELSENRNQERGTGVEEKIRSRVPPRRDDFKRTEDEKHVIPKRKRLQSSVQYDDLLPLHINTATQMPTGDTHYKQPSVLSWRTGEETISDEKTKLQSKGSTSPSVGPTEGDSYVKEYDDIADRNYFEDRQPFLNLYEVDDEEGENVARKLVRMKPKQTLQGQSYSQEGKDIITESVIPKEADRVHLSRHISVAPLPREQGVLYDDDGKVPLIIGAPPVGYLQVVIPDRNRYHNRSSLSGKPLQISEPKIPSESLEEKQKSSIYLSPDSLLLEVEQLDGIPLAHGVLYEVVGRGRQLPTRHPLLGRDGSISIAPEEGVAPKRMADPLKSPSSTFVADRFRTETDRQDTITEEFQKTRRVSSMDRNTGASDSLPLELFTPSSGQPCRSQQRKQIVSGAMENGQIPDKQIGTELQDESLTSHLLEGILKWKYPSTEIPSKQKSEVSYSDSAMGQGDIDGDIPGIIRVSEKDLSRIAFRQPGKDAKDVGVAVRAYDSEWRDEKDEDVEITQMKRPTPWTREREQMKQTEISEQKFRDEFSGAKEELNGEVRKEPQSHIRYAGRQSSKEIHRTSQQERIPAIHRDRDLGARDFNKGERAERQRKHHLLHKNIPHRTTPGSHFIPQPNIDIVVDGTELPIQPITDSSRFGTGPTLTNSMAGRTRIPTAETPEVETVTRRVRFGERLRPPTYSRQVTAKPRQFTPPSQSVPRQTSLLRQRKPSVESSLDSDPREDHFMLSEKHQFNSEGRTRIPSLDSDIEELFVIPLGDDTELGYSPDAPLDTVTGEEPKRGRVTSGYPLRREKTESIYSEIGDVIGGTVSAMDDAREKKIPNRTSQRDREYLSLSERDRKTGLLSSQPARRGQSSRHPERAFTTGTTDTSKDREPILTSFKRPIDDRTNPLRSLSTSEIDDGNEKLKGPREMSEESEYAEREELKKRPGYPSPSVDRQIIPKSSPKVEDDVKYSFPIQPNDYIRTDGSRDDDDESIRGGSLSHSEPRILEEKDQLNIPNISNDHTTRDEVPRDLRRKPLPTPGVRHAFEGSRGRSSLTSAEKRIEEEVGDLGDGPESVSWSRKPEHPSTQSTRKPSDNEERQRRTYSRGGIRTRIPTRGSQTMSRVQYSAEEIAEPPQEISAPLTPFVSTAADRASGEPRALKKIPGRTFPPSSAPPYSIRTHERQRISDDRRDANNGYKALGSNVTGSSIPHVACTRPGLFYHPADCNKFYECYWDRWLEKFTLHLFECPVKLVFDDRLYGCSPPEWEAPCLLNGNRNDNQ